MALAALLALTVMGGARDAVRVLHVDASSPRLPHACMRTTPLRRGAVTAVLRRGPILRSVTVRRRGDALVYGCDAVDGRWCNAEAGRLLHGSVTDPRLGLLCRTRKGRHVGTAWVNAPRGATLIVVGTGASRKAYPAAAGLPVRVGTTAGIRYSRAEATFVITQLDGRGRRLLRTRIVAHVSG